MRWLTKRGLLLLAAGAVVGVTSGILWPGNVGEGDSITVVHWLAVAGFLIAAALVITASVAIFVAMVGSAWEVKSFNMNDYLERMKRRR